MRLSITTSGLCHVKRCLKGKGYTFRGGDCQILCFASEKGIYSKRKEFAPTGSKFFPEREDPFQEGA